MHSRLTLPAEFVFMFTICEYSNCKTWRLRLREDVHLPGRPDTRFRRSIVADLSAPHSKSIYRKRCRGVRRVSLYFTAADGHLQSRSYERAEDVLITNNCQNRMRNEAF